MKNNLDITKKKNWETPRIHFISVQITSNVCSKNTNVVADGAITNCGS